MFYKITNAVDSGVLYNKHDYYYWHC